MKSFQVLLVVMLLGLSAPIGSPGSQLPSAPSSDPVPTVAGGVQPQDIYPESLNRLPLVTREELDDAGKKLYDESVKPPRGLAGLKGVGGARLYSPQYAVPFRAGLDYLRFRSDLGRRLTELATLVATRELDSQYEWTAHEPAALAAGLEQEIIDIVKHRKATAGLGDKEEAIIQLGREVFSQKRVGPETFARALRLFGRQGVVNIALLMGSYAGTEVLLRTVDQQLDPSQKPLLPMP